MRGLLLVSLVAGCGSVVKSGGEIDAGVDAAIDARPIDAAIVVDAPVDAPRMIVAELALDTVADELTPDWNFDQLQPVLQFTNGSRWTFTCSGGGATAGTWTVDMTKGNADACINRIVAGPVADYNVTQVSGTTTLAAPVIQCGSNKQISLRGTGIEAFTIFPPHAMSLEGQWCNNTITSGTAPPSSHRMTVVER